MSSEKKRESITGLYDIHCHIIPNVDDGAADMKEAHWMLRKEYEEGVRRIIATPHFRYDMFEPDPAKVYSQFRKLKVVASSVAKDLEIYLGCELHSSMDMADCLKEGKRMTLAGSRYVLTEFGNSEKKEQVRERVQQLIFYGYIPIIAHVERCKEVMKDFEFIEELKRMGACMQVNAGSITGKSGFLIKRFCYKLMKMDYLDFVGTDGHGRRARVPEIAESYKAVSKAMGDRYARKIFIKNPKKIFE